jgi:hypothetical protein
MVHPARHLPRVMGMIEWLRLPGRDRYKAFLEAHKKLGQPRLARAPAPRNRRRTDRLGGLFKRFAKSG